MPAASSRWLRVPIVVAALLAAVAGAWLLARGRHDEFASLRGHQGAIFSLALSPDGKEIASGGGDGAVCIWDVDGKQRKHLLTGHAGRVLALAWSPDGTTLASGGADKSVRLWDAKTGAKKQARTNLPTPVAGLAYGSDGDMLAAAIDAVVLFWDKDISLTPRRIQAHDMYISGLAFLPGRHELTTFGADKKVRIWDLDTSEKIAEMPGPTGHCHGLALSADGKLLACIGGGRVHLFDLETRRPLETIEPNARTLCGVAIAPDKQTLAFGSEDKVIVLWDLLAKKERARLRGHHYAVGPMAFLPDGQVLVTGGYDGTLKFWNIPSKSEK